MGCVDDAEFWFDPAADVVQVRLTSRIRTLRAGRGVWRRAAATDRARLVA